MTFIEKVSLIVGLLVIGSTIIYYFSSLDNNINNLSSDSKKIEVKVNNLQNSISSLVAKNTGMEVKTNYQDGDISELKNELKEMNNLFSIEIKKLTVLLNSIKIKEK